MDKGQGGGACNSNSQYISDDKNLTPHSSGENCNNGIENTVQIIFSHRTVELKQSNSICPFSLNFQNYTLMLMKKKTYMQNRKPTNVYLKVPEFYTFPLYSFMNYNFSYIQAK